METERELHRSAHERYLKLIAAEEAETRSKQRAAAAAERELARGRYMTQHTSCTHHT